MPSDIERCDCGPAVRGGEHPSLSLCSNHFREIELTSTPRKKGNHGIFHQNADMILTGSRQEFLPGDTGGSTITYQRKGGVFITARAAVLIVLAALALALLAGVVVYFFIPHGDAEKAAVEDDDLWNIGKIHVRNVDDHIRLLPHIIPTYYRLKIKPDYTTFTFEGTVAITLHTKKTNIKHISLHAKDLEIYNNTVLTEQLIVTSQMKDGSQIMNNRTRRDAGITEYNYELALSEDATTEGTSIKVGMAMMRNDEGIMGIDSAVSASSADSVSVSADGGSASASASGSVIGASASSSSNSGAEAKIAMDGENSSENTTTESPKTEEQVIQKVNISQVSQEVKQRVNGTQLLSTIKKKHIKIISKELKPKIDRLIFTLESHLKPNVNYTLEISFRGLIDDSLTGFYRSDFRYNNTDETLLVTQFEPTSARKAFPCFDEPNFKAVFEISIARPENMTAISNMPLVEEEPIEGEEMVWSHFEKSIPMSSYLVGYTVSNLVALEAKPVVVNDVEIPFKIWARKEFLQQTQYAAEIGPKIFQFYMKYFGVTYALPKIDLLGIPDFASGAMENWGMLTFSETSLLLDPDSDSIRSKRVIAAMLAHELSHQWFGNLVTMKWWNDLWLNEGFATYLEYIGVNAIEPSWGMLDQFSSDRMQIMVADSLETTRPVSALVNDETQIGQLFDDISYIKAASLLRMLNKILTEEAFHQGLVEYMREWQFRSADQNDLWSAFTEAANDTSTLPEHITIADLMKTWTLQPGYPVINVTRNYANGTATITQNRFYLANPTKGMTKELWYVPLTYGVGNTNSDTWDTVPKGWLEKTEKTSLLLPENANDTWVYFNVLGIGHYRVNYDHANWKLLQYGLDDAFRDFPTIARAQLLDDAFNLARAGQLNYSVPFDLSKYMIGEETDMLPWEAVLENLLFLNQVMQRSRKYDLFQDYISCLIMPTLINLGFSPADNESTQDIMLRDKLIEWACLIEEPDCVDWAWMHYNSWTNQTDPDKTNPIRFSTRYTVYKTILRLGGKKEYEFLYKRYEFSNDPEVQMEILRALPSTRTTWQLYSLFDYSITTMNVGGTPALWTGVESDIAAQIAFKFILLNWEKVYTRYALMEEQMLQSVISGAFRGISTETELRQFKRFIGANKEALKNVSELIMKHLEMAVLRIQWRRNKMQDVERWLVKFNHNKKVALLSEESTLW